MIPEDQLINNPDQELANKQFSKKVLYCPFCNDGRVQFKLLWKAAGNIWQCSNPDCEKIIHPGLKETGITKLKGRMRNQSSKLVGIVNITEQLNFRKADKFSIDLGKRHRFTKDGKHIIVDFNDNNLQAFDNMRDIFMAVPYDIDDPSTYPRRSED